MTTIIIGQGYDEQRIAIIQVLAAMRGYEVILDTDAEPESLPVFIDCGPNVHEIFGRMLTFKPDQTTYEIRAYSIEDDRRYLDDRKIVVASLFEDMPVRQKVCRDDRGFNRASFREQNRRQEQHLRSYKGAKRR